jgi:hypothetical protein
VLQKQEVPGSQKKWKKRLENNTQKLGRDKACENPCEREQRREQGRDYELEWAILQAGSKSRRPISTHI